MLLVLFCFSHAAFGWAVLSNGLVYLHNNHFHIFKYNTGNDLAQTNNEDENNGASFDLTILKSTDLNNSGARLKLTVEPACFKSDGFSNTAKFNIKSQYTSVAGKNNFISMKLFLLKSSYII